MREKYEDGLPDLEYGSVAQTPTKLKNLYEKMGKSSASYVTIDDGTQVIYRVAQKMGNKLICF